MLSSFPSAFGVDLDACEQPDMATLTAVLGKKGTAAAYTSKWLQLFEDYQRLFKRSSKPVSHIGALAGLTDAQLRQSGPAVLRRLAVRVGELLDNVPA